MAGIVIIGGPTASGKSALALEAARRLGNGVIINADASQLYRDLRLLSARPDAAEEALAEHRLYGVLDGAVRGTVAGWLDLAHREISTVLAAGKTPVVVGGTTMYLGALLAGLAPVPEIAAEVREAAVARHAEWGGEKFRSQLLADDPDSAHLPAGDTQRLIRAYEVITGTGRSLKSWQAERAWAPPVNWRFHPIVLMPPRATLYDLCNQRFVHMLEAGAADEVAALSARRLDPQLPVMKAVGVREIAAWQAGVMTKAEAITAAQQATRNYAKRQLTWFRHHLPYAARWTLPPGQLPAGDELMRFLENAAG